MALFAASMDRLGEAWPGRAAKHVGALASVGALVILLETQVAALDHGTHLLLALVAVLGTAVVLGTWPAVSGLAAGAVLAGSASALGVTVAADAAVPVLAYLVVGATTIALASLAIRSRRPPAVVAEPAGPPPTGGWAPTAGAPAAPPTGRGLPASPPAGLGTEGLVERLTAREAEVLHMAATGASVEEMAARLGVSPNTVKTHLTHVYAKLGVRGRTDAVRAALHAGWLTPGDICPHHFGSADEIHRFR